MTPNNEEQVPQRHRVDVHEFRIVQTKEGLYQLSIHGHPLLTYAGDPASHRSEQLIQQIIDELDGQGRIFVEGSKIVQPHFNLSYTILCIQKHMIETGRHPERGFAQWITHDPILYRWAGPEVTEQMARWEPVLEYLSDLGLHLPSLVAYHPDPSEFETNEEYLEALESNLPDKGFCDRIETAFEQLLPEQKAVVLHLSCIHHGLVLLPLILVIGRITTNDYARGAMAAHALLVDVFQNVEDEEYRHSFDELRNHAHVALSYLKAAGITEYGGRYFNGQPVRVEETRTWEFKEIKGQNAIDAIKNTADEYVVSFLNSEGGHVLWGVKDADRTVVGVTLNQEQRDRLRQSVACKLGEIQPRIDPTQYRISFYPVVDVDGPIQDCFVVEVFAPGRIAGEPYYTGGHECFVRVDGVKKKLNGPALTDWIRQKLRNQME